MMSSFEIKNAPVGPRRTRIVSISPAAIGLKVDS
jgi:hypothetical protein